MSTSRYVPPPSLSGKSYEQYSIELDLWESITEVAKEKQAGTVAFSLPEEHESRIREKVFNELKLEDLNKAEGLKTLKDFLDKHLKKDDLTDRWLKYDDFDECKRSDGQSVDDFIVTFDEKYNKIKKGGSQIQEDILAFMMLKRARLSKEERLLVVSGMDYTKKTELYEQAKTSLRKFKGDQAYVGGASSGSGVAIKLEPTFLAQHEEALYLAGYQRVKNQNFRGRSRSLGPRGGRGGSRQHERERSEPRQRNSDREKRRDEDGDTSNRRNDTDSNSDSSRSGKTRKMNPVGSNGQVLTCIACGSFRHLLADCPDSWENLEKAYVCYSEEIEIVDEEVNTTIVDDYNESDEVKEIDLVLFTGGVKTDISELGNDTKNSMVLDSACTRNVCGRPWLYCFLDSLNNDDRKKLKFSSSKRIYKFGGGERLKSEAEISIPAFINGLEIMIDTDVVASDIPLLWSTKDMKRAGVILNYQNDTAEVFGQLVHLITTRSGHYCIPIAKTEIKVEHVCTARLEEMNPTELHKSILHLHRQFAHPPEEKLIKLLIDAGVWRKEYENVLKKIIEKCETCKEYAKVPPRPVVALPMASRFNQKVAMDLKQWETRWILHLIDMFTRFTVSVFVERKKPSEILDKIMIHWVGAGFGVMEGILTDNGGEFNSDETREVCSVLNVVVNTTAGESPFQNGLCERVHSVTDIMLLKLRADNPNIDIEVLLCWACNARNSLQMWHGFSSYQLVFGQNPNLPNVMTDNPPSLHGSTTSEMLATHINALHAARQAFIQSESSERVRRALRHKVRASEQKFSNGDRVYYKRQGKDRLLGPAKVVFQDGKVVFVRHGGVFVRVSPNHLIKDKNEFVDNSINENETKSRNDINDNENKHSHVKTDAIDDGDESIVVVSRGGENVESQVLDQNAEPYVERNIESQQFPKKGDLIQLQNGDQWEEVTCWVVVARQEGSTRNGIMSKTMILVKPGA